MWYKEWLETRYKMIAAIIVYIGIGLFSFLSWIRLANYEDLATTWYTQTFFANIFVGSMCGINLIDKEKEMISFLLTRPLSRTKIYTSKILFNIGWFSVIYLLASFIIIGLSFLPITLDRWDYTALVSRHDRPAPVMRLDYALVNGLLTWVIGVSAICHTAYISVLKLKGLTIYLVSGLTFCTVAVAILSTHSSFLLFYPNGWIERPKLMFLTSLIIGVISGGFFQVGIYLFRRREY